MRRRGRIVLSVSALVVVASTVTSVVALVSAAEQRATTVSGWGGFDVGQSVVAGSLAGREVWSVSAGDEHSLAITPDGAVTGWGWNGDGPIDVPADLATGATMASSVDAGVYASLAIAWDGSVRGWGALGDTDEGQVDIPAELRGPTRQAAPAPCRWAPTTRSPSSGKVESWRGAPRDGTRRSTAGQTHAPRTSSRGRTTTSTSQPVTSTRSQWTPAGSSPCGAPPGTGRSRPRHASPRSPWR